MRAKNVWMHGPISKRSLGLGLALLTAGCSPWPPWQGPDRPAPSIGAMPAPEAVARPPVASGPLELPSQAVEARPEPVIERGTGQVIGRPTRSEASLTTDLDGRITLNVVDADLREVVRLVLEDTLGVNYVIDPLVEGTITVQTSQPLPADDLLALLDAVLRLNGAALVQTGDLYKVVPIEQALTSGLSPEVRPVAEAGEAGFTIRIVPLDYVGANEMAELLAPFAPGEGAVQVEPERNLLILTGSPDQIRTLTELVQIFDVDWLAGMSFGLFPLQSAQAERLAGELGQIFGVGGDGETGVPGGAVRFVPIQRLNAVLVISPQESYVRRAGSWIERLDQAGEGDEPQIYVYAVQNGRASDLAEVLGQLFDISAATVGADAALAPGLEPIELRSRTQSPLGGAEGETLLEEDRSAGGLRVPSPPRASALGAERSRALAANGAGAGAEATRIIADQTTNSLVVRATPPDYRRIEAALERLDIQPLQVLIEATIAEVTLRDELRYGLQWFFRFGSNEVRLSTSDAGAVASRFPGFSAIFTSSNDVRVILDALESITDVNVVSSPQLLVLDNQTAQLQVGDEVPIVTRQAQDILDDDDVTVVNTVEQRQTGVILTVTPRVNAGGLVIMEIEQEVSDVEETTTSDIDSPTISQRRIASTVAVQSGEAVALGGLIQDDREQSRSGLPWLARLPVLGWLFGQTSDVARRTELLVLITPRVVRDQDEARQVTRELRQRLRGIEPLDTRLN